MARLATVRRPTATRNLRRFRSTGPGVHHRMVRVSVLYLPDCPTSQEAGRRLRHALDQLGHPATAVTFVAVRTHTEATALDFPGSPTITVDGEDLFPTGRPPGGLSCRVYPTATGPAGVPDLADLTTALNERAHR